VQTIDLGAGAPIVIVPGIQGRWEWMKPGVEALARRCRVVTFTLAKAPPHAVWPSGARGLDGYVEQVEQAMAAARLDRAVICGVSYGGAIAAAFAARHPERTDGLVLVSALAPGWTPNARARAYLRAPRLFLPLFMLNSLRLYGEIAQASGTVLSSLRVSARHVFTVLTHMFSPVQMARRVSLLASASSASELARLKLPTLVVTGQDGLDRVVPTRHTREYLRLWPHAEHATISRTGHLGIITRPDDFAEVVGAFVERASAANQERRRIG
jgi:pimeloyl-ACP methyl ester carboxylesterase